MTLRPPVVTLEWPPESHEAEEMRLLGIRWVVQPRQPVVPPKTPRRYTRRRDAKLSQRHVDACWKLYEAGWSLRRIAGEIWERFGFASSASARVALEDAFRRDGRQLRDRIEATKAASTKHGRAPRRGRAKSYRRWLLVQRGDARPQCEGIKRGYPGRGKRCSRPAMRGSDFCQVHAPERQDSIAASLADLRARKAA